MRAGSDLAATYGILTIPPGMTESEAIFGLWMNTQRIRAMECLTTMQAIGVAFSDDRGDSLAQLQRVAGISERSIRRGQADRWKEEQKNRAMSRSSGK